MLASLRGMDAINRRPSAECNCSHPVIAWAVVGEHLPLGLVYFSVWVRVWVPTGMAGAADGGIINEEPERLPICKELVFVLLLLVVVRIMRWYSRERGEPVVQWKSRKTSRQWVPSTTCWCVRKDKALDVIWPNLGNKWSFSSGSCCYRATMIWRLGVWSWSKSLSAHIFLVGVR